MHIKSPRQIGRVVRQFRQDGNLTQAELAKRLGTSRKWVSDLEFGKTGIRLELALNALDALGIKLTAQLPARKRRETPTPTLEPTKQVVVMEHFVNNAPSAKDQRLLDRMHEGEDTRKKSVAARKERFHRAIAADYRRCTAAGMSVNEFVRTRRKGGTHEGNWTERTASERTMQRAIRAFGGANKLG